MFVSQVFVKSIGCGRRFHTVGCFSTVFQVSFLPHRLAHIISPHKLNSLVGGYIKVVKSIFTNVAFVKSAAFERALSWGRILFYDTFLRRFLSELHGTHHHEASC
jgi:hypothetical protein